MPELQSLLSLGVGGVVAGVVLYWKRQDDKTYQDRLKQLVEQSNQVVAANTAALNNLAAAVQSLAVVQRLEDRIDKLAQAGVVERRESSKRG